MNMEGYLKEYLGNLIMQLSAQRARGDLLDQQVAELTEALKKATDVPRSVEANNV